MEDIVSLPRLPARKPDGHKGDYGHVLVVAGSQGYTGAAYLCAKAALRSGAGLVSLGVPAGVYGVLAVKHTCVMVHPLADTGSGALAERALDRIRQMCQSCDVVALGPGVGRHSETEMAVRTLVHELPRPLIVDADGLNALAGDTSVLDGCAGERILTPHPGEMARLMGSATAAEVQADRAACAGGFVSQHPCVLVLKGHRTLVCDGNHLFTNATGNPGMATGGTGDVLTGCIAGLAAQGLAPFDAARLGVFLHGLAGDAARDRVGEACLIATDVLDELPTAFRRYFGFSDKSEGEVLMREVVGRAGP